MVSFSEQSSRTRSRTDDITPRAFKGLREDVAGSLLGFLDTGGPELSNSDLRRFRKNFAVPPTDAELGSLGRLDFLAQNPSVTEIRAEDLLARELSGEFLDPNNPTVQNFIQAALRPIQEGFEQNSLEARSLFTRAGQNISQSSPFSGVQADINRDFLNATGDTTANILFGVFNEERNRQGLAVDRARELAQFRFTREVENLNAQALPRLIEQHGIDLGVSVFEARLNALAQVLGIASGATATTPGARSASDSSGTSSGVLS